MTTTYILALTDLTRADAGHASTKAANLGDQLRAGFPVPEGFVLTTAAFERFLAANALGLAATPEAILAAQLPADIEPVLRSAAAALGDVPLAPLPAHRRVASAAAVWPFQSAPAAAPRGAQFGLGTPDARGV
ncbi:MAG: hypothetical protein HY332_16850 [Chloroflexi bacterium]|nr:hypothetical protein [Chloroflexota bacterium]